MRNLIPIFSVLVFMGGLVTLLFMPMQISTNPAKILENNKPTIEESLNPDVALSSYYVWASESFQWAKDIQFRLHLLENKFPNDYRFTLERVRGLKNLAGIEGGQKVAVSLLAEAASKAIDAKSAKEMLAELERSKDDKVTGFGQLAEKSTKDWKKVVSALSSGKKSRLKSLIIAQP